MFKKLDIFQIGLLASVLILGITFVGQANADDKVATPMIAMQCLSCHSATGKPLLEDVPIIAGQQPIYLFNALNHYKNGTRTAGQALVMQEMVKGLSNDDLKTLADWFGAQK